MTDQPSTAATCAAGCGQPIDLAQDHVAIVRHVEREDELGNFHIGESKVLERFHVDCDPQVPKWCTDVAMARALHDADCGCGDYDQVEDPRYIDAVRAALTAGPEVV